MSGLVLVLQMVQSVSDDSDTNNAGIATNSTIVSDKRPSRVPPPRRREHTSSNAHCEKVRLCWYSLILSMEKNLVSRMLNGSPRKAPSADMSGRPSKRSYSA